MATVDWESPNRDIQKTIISKGNWGSKPTENCICSVKFVDCSSLELKERYHSVSLLTVGDSSNRFERLLDECLLTMHKNETARFKVQCLNEEVSFTLCLEDFQFNGLIYEWTAAQKYDLALKHKQRGNELFNESRYIDSLHRFSKALKVLCSIPVQVDVPPAIVDGIKVEEINKLKVNLYNNLASCYLKRNNYEMVLSLCCKIFEIDRNNVKGLYKEGVAKYETHDYHGSQASFMRALDIEPENKAVIEKLKNVNSKVSASNARVNSIFKKMFPN